MYAVLKSHENGRSFYGHRNMIALGPFLSAKDALHAADGDHSKVIHIQQLPGVTDKFLWDHLKITEVYR